MPTIADINRQMARLFQASDGIMIGLEDAVATEIKRAYRSALVDIRNEVAERFTALGDTITLAQMQKFNRLGRLEADIVEHLNELGVATTAELSGSIKKQFSETFFHTGYAIETPLDLDLGFGGLSRSQIQAVAVNPLDRITWPVRHQGNIAALENRIRQTLTTGFTQGFGFGRMSAAIKDDIDRTLFETNRILRTEGQKSKSIGRKLAHDQSRDAAEKLGVDIERVWDATLDARTRGSHQALDQRPANENDAWRFPDGTTTSAPGLSGVAKHDIHCRCTTRVQVDGMKPETRRDQENREDVPHQDYGEWVEGRNKKIRKKGRPPSQPPPPKPGSGTVTPPPKKPAPPPKPAKPKPLIKSDTTKKRFPKPDEFQSARTVREAEKRLLQGSVVPELSTNRAFTRAIFGNENAVNFPGVGLNELNSILRATAGTLVKYSVPVSGIGFRKGGARALGTYHRFGGLANIQNDFITIQRKYFKNAKTEAVKARENMSLSLAHRRSIAEKNLKTFRSGDAFTERDKKQRLKTIAGAESALVELKATERWSISNVADDPLFATMSHEGWHAVYFRNRLGNAWIDNLEKFGVTFEDRLKVSEYGATKGSELWAEVGSAIDSGIKIPANVRKAFEATIKTLQVN